MKKKKDNTAKLKIFEELALREYNECCGKVIGMFGVDSVSEFMIKVKALNMCQLKNCEYLLNALLRFKPHRRKFLPVERTAKEKIVVLFAWLSDYGFLSEVKGKRAPLGSYEGKSIYFDTIFSKTTSYGAYDLLQEIDQGDTDVLSNNR